MGTLSPSFGNLRVQINQIDYTLAPPGPLDNSTLPMVPVLRIYGPSENGKKTCVHIHQVYPYFFVEYSGVLEANHVKNYATKLRRSLNHAVALSLRKEPASSKSRYIRSVVLVKGVHFYGFHSSYSPFLKVLVADPALVSRVVAMMQNGTVMGTRFCIYESHLNYTLQFLSDFGLYGCGWLELDNVFQRGQEENTEGIQQEPLFPLSPHFRQSRMTLEVDAAAHQILNRRGLSAREWHHKLEIPSPPLPSDPLVLSVRELWEDERARRRSRGLNPSPEIPVDLSESSRGSGGSWVAEARYWDEIGRRIEQERTMTHDIEDAQSWEGAVMTTFESIEALWEEEYKTWKPRKVEHDKATHSETEVTATVDLLPGEDSVEDDLNIDVDVSFLSVEEPPTDDMENVDEDEYLDRPEYNQPEDEFDDGVDDDTVSQNGARSPEGEEDEEISDNPFLDNPSGSDVGNILQFKNLTKRAISEDSDHSDRGSPTPTKRPKLGKAKLSGDAVVGEPTRTLLPSLEDPVPKAPLPIHSLGAPGALIGPVPATIKVAIPQTIWSRAKILTPSNYTYMYSNPPPTTSQLLSTIEDFGLKSRIYRAPYYSNEKDAPLRPREYAGLVYNLKGGEGIALLDDWVSEFSSQETSNSTFSYFLQGDLSAGGWEYAGAPPSVKEVRTWLRSFEGQLKQQLPKLPSRTQALRNVSRGKQDMSILSLEVFAPSNTGRLPHAEENELVALFYTFQMAEDEAEHLIHHVACVNSAQMNAATLPGIALEAFSSELDLINSFIDIVIDLDPDIITGWDVQNSSWGYLAARARSFGLELEELLARAPPRYSSNNNIQWDARHTTTFKVAGRHVFNLWRIMRSEQTLNIYTFENVAFHVLGRRVPKYGPLILNKWYQGKFPAGAATLARYFVRRASLNIEILNRSEVVTKTAEFARVFGVDFYSVISRGSQFKVESFMFRMAKPESFVLISPSKSDVGKQNAAECIPLIMEPQSALYTSPLVVLDFQSLYPSLMISQNMCYSTCLGRVMDFQGRNKFGVVDLDRPSGLLEKLKDHINVAPNGIMFLKPNVRKGLLPRMLTELLDTRVMVKQAMKGYKHDKGLTRVLNARQLGLKYIANVTYGYTSASFSGRMPAVEMADSIVQSGRETLEKAIALVHETKRWGAEVVYGDTDSMFIYMQGKTREQAFRIGHEIADAVTALNPAPVKLKFEKVYHPCVLMAKKRYVGFKYENVDDKEPVFEAKGIETVRRDGIVAQQKMTENCLKILFRTQDLSKVKEYCYDSWTKILENRAPVQDFIFAKEVKMGTYSDKGPPPPGVAVATKRTLLDPGDEPQYGERVPYVIAQGEPGSKLVDRATDPLEFLRNPHTQLDATYYISRVLIPPLERIFNLVGADVPQWYNEMPKARQIEVASPSKRGHPQVFEAEAKISFLGILQDLVQELVDENILASKKE
ncbi:DNA polymerase zeta catalytic subunit [Lentinula edodes]|uniref:DNA polymerase n=1 Tax=Lentinula edodes TaxID=5353 RepID=A0A1Q3E8Y0_LENED|nr:DNA polymerase zeta catalytic subunit [Lentinula edodes]